jgi:chemotaxis response regulator CheB
MTIIILIICTNPLLNYSLKSVFDSDPLLQVILSQARNGLAIIEAVELHRPDAMIIDNQTAEINWEAIAQLLIMRPRLHIISISIESNWVQVVKKENYLLTNSIDLLSLVHQSIA